MAFGTNKIFTSNANELKKELIMQDLIKKNGAYIHDRAKTAIADASIAHITKTKIFNSNFELINEKVNQLNFDIFAITLQKKIRVKNFNHFYNLSFDFKFFDGINGHNKNYNPEDSKYLKNKSINKKFTGAAGCFLSHVKIYEELIRSNKDFFIIFEDDAVFFDYSNILLQLVLFDISLDMDFIYINGRASALANIQTYFDGKEFINSPTELLTKKEKVDSKILKNIQDINPDLQKNNFLLPGMDGYVITKSGAKKIIDFLNSQDYKNIASFIRIDPLVARLSSSKKFKLFEDGYLPDKPYLNSYIVKYPVSHQAQNIGLKIESDIHNI